MRRLQDREMEDLLWAWGGKAPEPGEQASRSPWRVSRIAAALLLAAASSGWWWARRPAEVPPPSPAASAPEVAGRLQAGSGIRGFHPGQGVLLVLGEGSAVSAAWQEGGLVLDGLSGTLWLDLPQGVSARLSTPLGTAGATGAAFGASLEPGSSRLAGIWIRSASAGEGGGLRLAVARGRLSWAPSAGEGLEVAGGEFLEASPGQAPRVLRDAAASAGLCGLGDAWAGRGWQSLVGDGAAGLSSRSALAVREGVLASGRPDAGMGRIRAEGLALPSWYEMEVRLRRTEASGGAGLVYEAWGRRPICMLPGDGWHTLSVLVAPSGVELRVDGALAQALPPEVVQASPTFEAGLDGAGLAFWESGLEVASWRWRRLDVPGGPDRP